MYRIEQEQGTYVNYRLMDTTANTSCTITPEKGGMCTSFVINGEEMLYINEENYYSDQRTRCACPILFPTTGVCDQDTLNIQGKAYPMGIHGIAHAQKWKLIEMATDEGAEVTIRLQANEETLKSFPFRFTYDLTYRLIGTSLSMHVKIQHEEQEAMPFSFGFHPYFKVSDVRNLTFDIPADLIEGCLESSKTMDGIDFPYASETKVIISKVYTTASFTDEETHKKVSLKFGKEIKHVVLWSLCEQNFLCMEPWNSLANGVNEGFGEVLLPGTTFDSDLMITIQR